MTLRPRETPPRSSSATTTSPAGRATTWSSASSATTRSRATASIDASAAAPAPRRRPPRLPTPTTGLLGVAPSYEAATDGDDYIEGGGGGDVDVRRPRPGRHHRRQLEPLRAEHRGRVRTPATCSSAGRARDVTRNDAGDRRRPRPRRRHHRRRQRQRSTASSGSNAAAVLAFTYDKLHQRRRSELLPRAVDAARLHPGRARRTSRPVAAPATNWGNDEVHGETGDDTIYVGARQRHRLYGDAGDDDIIGGWGHDWVSGGTGTDGVLGDDGRIFTRRNSTTRRAALRHRAAGRGRRGDHHAGQHPAGHDQPEGQAEQGRRPDAVRPAPERTSSMTDRMLFDARYANDVIFGGWGDDFIHGGAGNDALSGAEARVGTVAATYDGRWPPPASSRTGWDLPYNDGRPARLRLRQRRLRPLRRVRPAPPDHAQRRRHAEQGRRPDPPVVPQQRPRRRAACTRGHRPCTTDGDDVIFGDLGNDWLVGGTGRDTLWGGWGNDLLNADDKLDTNGGLNDTTDTHTSYEDRVVGGAGLDVLVGNTGGDRLIDWVGEFNSYIVPFAPFGAATVSRQVPPRSLPVPLRPVQGPGRRPDPGRARRCAVRSPQRRALRRDRPGHAEGRRVAGPDRRPARPAAGQHPRRAARRAPRGDLRRRDAAGLLRRQRLLDGQRRGAEGGGGQPRSSDAAAVFYVDDYLPVYYELAASVQTQKPTGGWKANAYLIFDYFSPTDFKFAGIDISTNKLVMGYRDAAGWHVVAPDAQADERRDLLQPAADGQRHHRDPPGRRHQGVHLHVRRARWSTA